jgi:hypothetical protein
MYVVLTCSCEHNHVEVLFHYLHPDVMRLTTALFAVPAPLRTDFEQFILSKARERATTLGDKWREQQDFEASAAREAVALGFRRHLLKCPDPFVLHDINTLYCSVVTGILERWYRDTTPGDDDTSWYRDISPDDGIYWYRDTRPCERCGDNKWSLTCTPPRFTARGRLTRDTLDDLTAFCWTCQARRPQVVQ